MKRSATFFAILAAALYAVNIPVSKRLLQDVSPTMMAAFLYLGAGIGLIIYSRIKKMAGYADKEPPLTKKELPYTIAMVVLDIAAPILLMFGISLTTSANVSLLNNFEIVATSLIALFIFKETISLDLWIAIALVVLSSFIIGYENTEGFSFNLGSLLVLLACVCWGFENNCTRKLSSKNTVQITTIKGCFSGLGSLIIAFAVNESLPEAKWIACVLLLGFVSYGLSINYYIKAQKYLGAARTSAYYSIAPFLGVLFSFILLGEVPNLKFYIALVIMLVATLFMVKDTFPIRHA